MNELQKYLQENKSIFDDKEPLEGHFERFEERLTRRGAEKKHGRRLNLSLIDSFSFAASILIIVVVGIWLLRSRTTDIESNISEFTETEAFYKVQMDEQIAAILCKLDKADEETQMQLKDDLRNITEENSKFLEEIKNQKDEELAIYYLVEHYNANLETLQVINDKLGEYFSC